MYNWREAIGKFNLKISTNNSPKPNTQLWKLIYLINASLSTIESAKIQISHSSPQQQETSLIMHNKNTFNSRRSRSKTSSPNFVTAVIFLVLFCPELIQGLDLSFNIDFKHEAITDNNGKSDQEVTADPKLFQRESTSESDFSDKNSFTNLMQAVTNGDYTQAQQLIQNGANVDARNYQDLTPLAQAVKNNDKKMVSLLLENGADVNAFTGKENPLLHAIMNGLEDVLRILLKHNADINTKYDQGNTPLMRAIAAGKPEIINILIQHGAALDLKNEPGFTALHLAVCYGNIKSISLLLTNGVNQNIRDSRHHLPAETVVRYIEYTNDSILKANAQVGQKFYDQYLKISKLIEENYYSDAVYEIKHSPTEYQRQLIFQKLLTQAEMGTTIEVKSYSWKQIILGLFALLAALGYIFKDRLAIFFHFTRKQTSPKPIQLSSETITNIEASLKELLSDPVEIKHERNNEFSLNLLESGLGIENFHIKLNKNLSKELFIIIKTYLIDWGNFNSDTRIFEIDFKKVPEFINLANKAEKQKQLRIEINFKIMEFLLEQTKKSANHLLTPLEEAEKTTFPQLDEFKKKIAAYKVDINLHLNDNKKWQDVALLLETEESSGISYYNNIKHFREKRFIEIKNEFNEFTNQLCNLKNKNLFVDFLKKYTNNNAIENLRRECEKYLSAVDELSNNHYEVRMDTKIVDASNSGIDSHEKQQKRKSRSKWQNPSEFLLKKIEKTDFETTKSESESTTNSNQEIQTPPIHDNNNPPFTQRDLYKKLPQTNSTPVETEAEKIILIQIKTKQQLSVAKDLCQEVILLPKSSEDSVSPQLYPLAVSRVIILLNIQILECLIQACQNTELKNYFEVTNIKKFRGIFRRLWMDFTNPEQAFREIFLQNSINTARLFHTDFFPSFLENKKIIGNYNPEENELYKIYSSRMNTQNVKVFFKSILSSLKEEIDFIKECLTRLVKLDLDDNKRPVYEKSLHASVLFVGYLRRLFRENYPAIVSEPQLEEDKSKICSKTRDNLYKEFFYKGSKPTKKPKSKLKVKKSTLSAKDYDKFKKDLKDSTKTPFYDLLALLSREDRQKLLITKLNIDELWLVAEEFNNMLAHDVPKFKFIILKNKIINLVAEIIVERMPELIEKLQQNQDQYKCRTVSSLSLVKTMLQPPCPPPEDVMKIADYINDFAFPKTTEPRFYSLNNSASPQEQNFVVFFRTKYYKTNASSDNDETITNEQRCR